MPPTAVNHKSRPNCQMRVGRQGIRSKYKLQRIWKTVVVWVVGRLVQPTRECKVCQPLLISQGIGR